MDLAMRSSLRTCHAVDAISAGCVSGELARKAVSAQYPLGRHGEAADAAELAAFPIPYRAVSQRAAWINGQIIAVDGGFPGVRPP